MPITCPPVKLLAQADLLFLAADLLRPPHRQPAGRWGEALNCLDDLVDAAGVPAIAGALREALVAGLVAETARWSDEYHRLFEGMMLCPPNQTAYVRRDKGAIIGDACGFYEAFSFRPTHGIGEKPDHIVSQLEFAGVLLIMRHGADTPERRDTVARALSDFAEAHPGEWIEAFAARLESVTELALYGAAARALRELWSALAEQHGLRNEPAGAQMVAAEEPDGPYECGLAPSPAVTLNVHGRAPGTVSPVTCA